MSQVIRKDKRLKPSYEIRIGHKKDVWYITADDKIICAEYNPTAAKEMLHYYRKNR